MIGFVFTIGKVGATSERTELAGLSDQIASPARRTILAGASCLAPDFNSCGADQHANKFRLILIAEKKHRLARTRFCDIKQPSLLSALEGLIIGKDQIEYRVVHDLA